MLTVFSINETAKWDELVKSFKNYDAYYLSKYTKAFQIHGDGEPTLFYYENNNTKAINVVMKRDIAKDISFSNILSEGLYFDIVTPYGYGGFLVEGEITVDSVKCLNDEYSLYCKSKNIVSEFVRFHPLLKNGEYLENMYDITKLGRTISIKLYSFIQIWGDLTSKNRNMIRKAQKSQINIFWGQNAELYKEFIQLYNATMDRDNAKDYYYFANDFYKSILDDFKYNSIIFYAVYQGKIIAMSIILLANRQMHYHLSASDKEYQHLAPTNLLLYEAACWGYENGYTVFHLGGGLGSGEDSLYKFKSAFNRHSDNFFCIGKKVFDEDMYENLVDMRKAEQFLLDGEVSIGTIAGVVTNFFPQYRAEFTIFNTKETSTRSLAKKNLA